MAARVPSEAAYDHVLVRCPRCDAAATIDARSGILGITCTSCGYVKRSEDPRLSVRTALDAYNSGKTILNAHLWLDTECCAGTGSGH